MNLRRKIHSSCTAQTLEDSWSIHGSFSDSVDSKDLPRLLVVRIPHKIYCFSDIYLPKKKKKKLDWFYVTLNNRKEMFTQKTGSGSSKWNLHLSCKTTSLMILIKVCLQWTPNRPRQADGRCYEMIFVRWHVATRNDSHLDMCHSTPSCVFVWASQNKSVRVVDFSMVLGVQIGWCTHNLCRFAGSV